MLWAFASATLMGIVFGLFCEAGGSCRLSNYCGRLHWLYANRAVVIATGGRIQLCYAGRFSVRLFGWVVVHAKSARRLSPRLNHRPHAECRIAGRSNVRQT